MFSKKLKFVTIFAVLFVLITSVSVTSVSSASAGVTISKPHYSVQIGSTVTIQAIGSGIIWSSSDPSVATVSQLGVVKGISMGNATITATSGAYSATCEITCGYYKGIDVSTWNREYGSEPVNWKKVKAQGIDFAFIRAGFGWEDYPYQMDSQFVNNINGCIENDIPFGLYFYSYATNSTEAVYEAKYLLRILDDYFPESKSKLRLPIAYDIEEMDIINSITNAELTNIALSFCNTLKASGYDTMVYGNTATFNRMSLDTLQKNDIGFWYAMWPYTPQFNEPETIGNTGVVPDVWQYASDGTVPGAGAANSVDMNVIYMLSTKTELFKDTSTVASISSPGACKATIKWDSVSGAQYNLYRAEVTSTGKINTANAVKLYSGSKTSFIDGSLKYGKRYYYYTDTSFSGDFLDPDYRKVVSGVEKGAYVDNVYSGDVSMDGNLSLIDAILIQKYVNGSYAFSSIQIAAADFDSSGKINLLDALVVQKRGVGNTN
ncbi:MAG: GH25 family lysozyme [Acutalibacteraceae bacterium]